MLKQQFWQRKKVFITGHTGFKGTWLSLWLAQLGAEVTGYALQPPTDPSLFELCALNTCMHSHIGDVRDYEHLLKTLKEATPEIVFHLAAQPLVRESYKNPVETYAINVMGTAHLLEAMRQLDTVRAVVNITTDKCYENKEWMWGYRENEPMGGYDPYSNSKACSELVTSAFRSSFFNPADYEKHGVAIATARAGNVIGGGDWAADRLIPDSIRAIEAGEKILIRNPSAIRPWQHVFEPLSGYLMLAERLHQEGTAFAEGWNFGPEDNDTKSVEGTVQQLCQLWGESASYEIDSGKHPHEANCLKLDCSKAKTRLDWHPQWCLEDALTRIVFWHKAYREKKDMSAVCLQQIADYTKVRGC